MQKLVVGLMAIIIANTGSAQTARMIPCMFVSRSVSEERVKAFTDDVYPRAKKSKGQVFNDACADGKHPLSYTVSYTVFKKLIDSLNKKIKDSSGTGIRIQFGAYDSNGISKPIFSENRMKKNQVFLIYSASKGFTNSDIKAYYVIVGNKVKPIKATVAKRLIDNYFAKVNYDGGLTSTLQPMQSENQGHRRNSAGHIETLFMDTRSIYYEGADFNDYFLDEVHYQDSIAKKESKLLINKIEIDFAAYPVSGIGANIYHQPHDRFKSRMILQFEFMHGNTRIYPEQTTGFGQRSPKCASAFSKDKFLGDNGQLCPSQCPSDDSTL